MGSRVSQSPDLCWPKSCSDGVEDRYSWNPDLAWSVLQVKQTVKPVQPILPETPKPENHTRFVCLSDTHSKTNGLSVPQGDVLLHAGDFSNVGLPRDIEKFNAFLGSLPHPVKVVIAGNHDLTFDLDSYDETFKRFGHPRKFDCVEVKSLLTNCIYLEDEETSVLGFRIYGSPWQPVFCDWAFNLKRGEPLREKWNKIPAGVDILMTHGPPVGHGDKSKYGDTRTGCVDLLHTVQTRVKPKYHVFGHIHEGYGVTTDGFTTYINASTCTVQYQPTNAPIIFDLPNS
ncbi:metallophosphoesterase MPPED2-like [Corticium candelabrum]|uniref:metallophosphoesterase MPPED2-like n=1 Tax=Corticium candelabrum TaxID=121492 RepID=UPI002E265263|nr:metallophosphoesterase MPPED2-like [Corticium candelabrum]